MGSLVSRLKGMKSRQPENRHKYLSEIEAAQLKSASLWEFKEFNKVTRVLCVVLLLQIEHTESSYRIQRDVQQ